MNVPLAILAQIVQGRLVGAGDQIATGVNTLAFAQPGEVTLCDCVRLLPQLTQCPALAVIVPTGVEPSDRPYIVVENPAVAFAQVVGHFRPARKARRVGIHPLAMISSSATLAPEVEVHAGATLGDDVVLSEGCVIHSGARIMDGCRLGKNVVVFPNAVLYENTLVGDRSIIHAGAVLGAYGFGYTIREGKHQLSAQLGYVQIEEDVEIGAGTTIDRGTYGPTLIGAGTKIDNQVQIAHNCRIGRHNIVCSQVGMAGSSSTGDYVVLAGQVGVKDHVHIGDRAMLGAKAGAMGDIPPGVQMAGSPAIGLRDQLAVWAVMPRLPEFRKQLRELERKVAELTRGPTLSREAA